MTKYIISYLVFVVVFCFLNYRFWNTIGKDEEFYNDMGEK